MAYWTCTTKVKSLYIVLLTTFFEKIMFYHCKSNICLSCFLTLLCDIYRKIQVNIWKNCHIFFCFLLIVVQLKFCMILANFIFFTIYLVNIFSDLSCLPRLHKVLNYCHIDHTSKVWINIFAIFSNYSGYIFCWHNSHVTCDINATDGDGHGTRNVRLLWANHNRPTIVLGAALLLSRLGCVAESNYHIHH